MTTAASLQLGLLEPDAAGDESPPAGAPAPAAKPASLTPNPEPLASEVSAITDELARHDRKRAELAARAPRGFDPACLFLLDLAPENLYEPTSAAPGERLTFRCKGCGAIVGARDRKNHHANHKRRTR